jgi:hypothetical protein
MPPGLFHVSGGGICLAGLPPKAELMLSRLAGWLTV